MTTLLAPSHYTPYGGPRAKQSTDYPGTDAEHARVPVYTLKLHVIAQHELLGVGMQVDLLVHPLGHRIAVKVML
jgi:hypothetical protein